MRLYGDAGRGGGTYGLKWRRRRRRRGSRLRRGHVGPGLRGVGGGGRSRSWGESSGGGRGSPGCAEAGGPRRPGRVRTTEVWRPVPWPPSRPLLGRPSRDEEPAGHSGRRVLEVGGERRNVMTSADHIPSRSVPLPNPPPVKGKDFQVKGPSILLPAITSHPGSWLGWLGPPRCHAVVE